MVNIIVETWSNVHIGRTSVNNGKGFCDIDMDSYIRWGTTCRTVGTRTCRAYHGKNDEWCNGMYINPVTLDIYKQKYDKQRNKNHNYT